MGVISEFFGFGLSEICHLAKFRRRQAIAEIVSGHLAIEGADKIVMAGKWPIEPGGDHYGGKNNQADPNNFFIKLSIHRLYDRVLS